MSITDELREFIDGADGYELWCPRHKTELNAIADRIDAEADDNERFRRDVEPFCDRLREAAAERADVTMYGVDYVALPVDADGLPIHIGDVMVGVNKYDPCESVKGRVIAVNFEDDGVVDVAVQVWSSDGKSWHRTYLDSGASVYHHYHEPTVEEVMQEMLERAVGYSDAHTTVALSAIAEYAAKLRLASDGEEQE